MKKDIHLKNIREKNINDKNKKGDYSYETLLRERL